MGISNIHKVETRAQLLPPILFLVNFSAIILEIFRDALFLSTYSPVWLPVFYLCQTALSFCLLLPIKNMIEKGLKRKNQILLSLGLFLSFVGLFFFQQNVPLFFFAYALFLGALSQLFLIASYLIVPFYANFEKQSSLGSKVVIAGSMGAIFGAFVTPFAMKLYDKINLLLYLGLFSLLIVWVCLFFLSVQGVKKEGFWPNKSFYFRYPLLQQLFPMAFIAACVCLFAKYFLSFQLSLSLSAPSIAIFLGGLLGITYLGYFLFQSNVTKQIINRFGISKLVLIAPFIVLVGLIPLLMYPSLMTLALFYVSAHIASENFNRRGLEIAINPLPGQVRFFARSFEEGSLKEVGILFASLILLSASSLLIPFNRELLAIGSLIIGFVILWIYFASKVKKNYLQALENAVNVRKFAGDLPTSDVYSLSFVEKLAEKIISGNNARLYPLACALFSRLPVLTKGHVFLLLKQIEEAEESFQLLVLRLLDSKHISIPQDLLKTLFINEEKEGVLWAVTEAFCKGNVKEALSLARHVAEEEKSSIKKAYAAQILACMGNFSDVSRSLKILKESLSDNNPEVRKACAQVLGSFPIVDCHEELKKMILDPRPEISVQAIQSTSKRKYHDLYPVILSRLGVKQVSYYASLTLKDFGDVALSQLYSLASKSSYSVAGPAIRTIAAIGGSLAEDLLLKLADHPSCMIKTWTARFSLRAAKQKRNPGYLSSVHKLILKEADRRSLFKRTLTLDLPSYVKKEIAIQLELASFRCLAWYAIYTNPKEANRIISLFLSLHHQDTHLAKKRGHYLELLKHLSTDELLLQSLNDWDKVEGPAEQDLARCEEEDPFLKRLIQFGV